MTPLAAIPSVPGIGQTEIVGPAGIAGGATPVGGAGTGFADLLSQKLGGVVDLQNQADQASQDVATGKSSDLAGATVAVEKASIAIDLVSAIRNKAVYAYQEVMRMQV
jgi:flagellar hook-basal body complex protein FliE